MNIRIGKNTAGAAGASLMDMANFLRQGGQIQASQAASRGNLVDQMAKRLLEQERQEKDAQADADRIAAERAKLDAKAKAEQAGRDGVAAFSRWVNENPTATFSQKNAKALELGVAGIDDSKNFLSGEMGNQRFGETVAENGRKGGRFTEQMKLKKAKLDSDIDYADRRLKQIAEQFNETMEENKRKNLRNEYLKLLSIQTTAKTNRLRISENGGFDVDDNNYLGYKQAAEDMERRYKELSEKQMIGLPDQALTIELQKLGATKDKLNTALLKYENDDKDGKTFESSSTQDSTPADLPAKEPAASPERKPAAKPERKPAAKPERKPAAKPAPKPAPQANEVNDLLNIMNQQRKK